MKSLCEANFDGSKSYRDLKDEVPFEMQTKKNKNVKFVKPIYLSLPIVELFEKNTEETSHDTLQLLLDPKREGKVQIHNIVCDSFFLNKKTKDLINHLFKLKEETDMFNYKKTDKDHNLFCNKKTDVIGIFGNKTLDI